MYDDKPISARYELKKEMFTETDDKTEFILLKTNDFLEIMGHNSLIDDSFISKSQNLENSFYNDKILSDSENYLKKSFKKNIGKYRYASDVASDIMCINEELDNQYNFKRLDYFEHLNHIEKNTKNKIEFLEKNLVMAHRKLINTSNDNVEEINRTRGFIRKTEKEITLLQKKLELIYENKSNFLDGKSLDF